MEAKRVGVLLLLTLLSAAVLAACGGRSGNGPGPGTAQGAYTLSMSVEGPGAVVIEELDTTCTGECRLRAGAGVELELQARADSGKAFVGWEQDCGGSGDCVLRMDGDLNVRAVFADKAVNLVMEGDGQGDVLISPPGTSCSDDCGQGYTSSVEQVSLSVSLADGSVTAGWGGACSHRARSSYCLVDVTGQTSVVLTLASPPVAVNDSEYRVDEDQTLEVAAERGVLANDSDPGGGKLTAELVNGPGKGNLDLRPDGSFSYAPPSDESGFDTFSYRARDAHDNVSESAEVTIEIVGVDDPLIPLSMSESTDEDVPVKVRLKASGGEGALTFSIVDQPANGNVSLQGNEATYGPKPDFNGEGSFRYEVTDSKGQTARADVAVKVIPVNDPPGFDLPNSHVDLPADPGAVSIQDFATSITAGAENESSQKLDFLVTREGNGELSFDVAPQIDTSGRLSFTVQDGSYGEAPFSAVLVDDPGDGSGLSSPKVRFVITVQQPSNEAPIAYDDLATVEEQGGTVSRLDSGKDSVLANDDDEDSANLTARLKSAPQHALEFELYGDGTFTYTHAGDGSVEDSFEYVAIDGKGKESSPATVTIQIAPPPDPAQAQDVEGSTEEDAAVELTLASRGGSGDESYKVTKGPQHGSVEPLDAKVVTYTPQRDYFGDDSFEFAVTDLGQESRATASISVSAVNDPPSFELSRPLIKATPTNEVQSFEDFVKAVSPGAANETDDVLTFTVQEVGGELEFQKFPTVKLDQDAGGTLELQLAEGSSGQSDFLVSLSDGQSETSSESFTVSVEEESTGNDDDTLDGGGDDGGTESSDTGTAA
jgi:hypothetical protein